MNILFLALDVDLNGSYGDTVHVRELAKAFRDHGCNVILFAGKGYSSKDLEGIPVKIFQKRFSGKLRFIDDLYAILNGILLMGFTGKRLIYERRFSCKIGMAVKWLTGASLLVEINGLVDDEIRVQYGGKSTVKVSGWSLRFADYIIAVTHGLAVALQRRYNIAQTKIKVVSNGVNPRSFYPRSRRDAKMKLGLDHHCRYLLFTGNFAAWYDFDTMLNGFKKIQNHHPDVMLLLVGGGQMKAIIESLISELSLHDKVIIFGRVAHEQVPEYIAASDICLAPFTRARNDLIGLSPIKIFEYSACGRPVVSNFDVGLETYAGDISSLHLINPEDYPSFANKIIELLDSPDTDACLEASEVVRSKYMWANTAKNILKIADSDYHSG